ncbi:MAG: quinolinate synthase NadA [Firmicutes bacterium]|nr:quinolinate synthase NadA [Bacillota bacterium]
MISSGHVEVILLQQGNTDALKDRIQQLKKQRNAVILAHNYQIGEVQDIADFVGDSLDLSHRAAEADAETIVFCGVHFMAESAAMLAPEKTVLLPEALADCPLANMVTGPQLKKVRQRYPGVPVVTYINSTAEVKAESDICCTSANAIEVVNSLREERVLFVPDKNLGGYVSRFTSKEVILWHGYCITHHRVTLRDIEKARRDHPGAPIIVHPECPPEVSINADQVLSTGGMVDFVARTGEKKLVIGTEVGLLYRLKKENPEKEFYLLSPGLLCPNMKYTTLHKVAHALEHMETVISVPEEIRKEAVVSLARMLEVR